MSVGGVLRSTDLVPEKKEEKNESESEKRSTDKQSKLVVSDDQYKQYVADKDFDNAIKIGREFWELLLAEFGADNKHTLEMQDKLVLCYNRTITDNNSQEILRFAQDCFDRRKEQYGETHHLTFTTQHNLACLLIRSNRVSDGIALLKDCFVKFTWCK